MKNIIFCADDYGQNSAISQAIIELLQKNRLSATSCLTTSDLWLAHAKWLHPFKNQADIGLHFNLTEGNPLSAQFKAFVPVNNLLVRSYLHFLDASAIEAELNAQLDRFIEGMGQYPQFVDGHQHIHQFPVVRKVFLKVYEKRLRAQKVYVRCVYDPSVWLRFRDSGYIKQCMIQLSGAYTFKKALMAKKIPHNQSFAGSYGFADAKDIAKMFPAFLERSKEGGLIMCHPGLENAEDPIGAARYQEFQYLSSDQFKQICSSSGVVVGRF